MGDLTNKQKEMLHEIVIRKVEILAPATKEEVKRKLEKLSKGFDFQGYAAICYAIRPFRILSVDPIEGTVISFYKRIIDGVKTNV